MTTTLKSFAEGEWPGKGLYRRTATRMPPGFSAVISCPGCGIVASLDQTHDVHVDGTVQPSILCDCGFHDFIVLEGY